MVPLVAAAGTRAVICVSDTTVKSAFTSLNRTAVAPVRRLPPIVTIVPGAPPAGLTDPIAGVAGAGVLLDPDGAGSEGAFTANGASLVAAPAGVSTVIGPLVAPSGTFAVSCPSKLTLKSALVPLNRTPVAPPSPLPVSCTTVPGVPAAGENATIAGCTGAGGAAAVVFGWPVSPPGAAAFATVVVLTTVVAAVGGDDDDPSSAGAGGATLTDGTAAGAGGAGSRG